MAYNPNFSMSDEELAKMASKIDISGTPLNGGNANTGINYPQNRPPEFSQHDIKAIARELNKLNDDESSRKSLTKKDELDEELNDVIFSENDDKVVKKKIDNAVSERGYLSSFFGSETFKDFAIILILFFVMSQTAVKDFWGQIFTAVNYNDDGTIGASGIFIYGLIFSILFIVIKRMA